ncbi:MAG TPA: ADOP family duplicated permease [Terriglobales bacterium]|nr:ADOP family duplicated permease [Terriglobales bacterium]
MKRRRERELEKELGFHLAQHAADLEAEGRTPNEAARTAQVAFGAFDAAAEGCREARPRRWLHETGRDLRLALRGLRRRPGFAAVLLITLGLGIGATTLMFSIARGVLLEPLPFSHPGALIAVQERTDQATALGNLWAFSLPNFRDARAAVSGVRLGAYRRVGGIARQPGTAAYLDGYEISPELLGILGVQPLHGRGFTAADNQPGAAPVALLSPAEARRRFGSTARALGARLTFEDTGYTVVGIAPAPLSAISGAADDGIGIYLPLGADPDPRFENRAVHGLGVIGRLQPGVSLAQARAQLDAAGRTLAVRYPATNHGRTFVAGWLRPDTGDAAGSIGLLFGAALLVLLLAGVNAANLLLADGATREREMVMRVALGAGRGRLIRQCLAESTLLATGGALLGLGLAWLGLPLLISLWPQGLPRAAEVQLDARVLLFSLAVAVGAGLLFGLAPALRVPRERLEASLRPGGVGGSGPVRRLHSIFVVAEVALAMVLLAGAGLLGRAVLRLSAVQPGVDTHNVLVARTALSAATLANPAATRAAWAQLLDRVTAVPGVASAAMVDTVPLRPGNNQINYWITPNPPPVGQQPSALATCVSPGYLQTLGLRLLRGRWFTAGDRQGTLPVAVIDESLARHAFGAADPIGRRIWIGLDNDPQTIVGVVAHVMYWGPANDPQARVRDEVYDAFDQLPDRFVPRWSQVMSVAVRTRLDPRGLLQPVRAAAAGAQGGQVLYEVRTMDELARAALGQQRFLLLLFGLFSVLALGLACIGVYGVLARLAAQRTAEIGVRMALGARPAQVLALVLRQSLSLTAWGVACGGIGAWLGARVMSGLVAGLGRLDAPALAATALLLAAAVLAASLPAARRAGRTDPVTALRQ